MKVKIKQSFHDINDFTKVYAVGEIAEFDEARANSIIGLQYGICVGADAEGTPSEAKVKKTRSNKNMPDDN